jgi:hypothetical protein
MNAPSKFVAGSWFEPADRREHQRASAGLSVPDYCQHCRQPFMSHYNGQCPKEDCAEEVSL